MTGYVCPTFWLAQIFGATNGFAATGQNVFSKQTADLGMMAVMKLPIPMASKHYLGSLEPMLEYLQRDRKTWFDSLLREV